MYHGGDLLSQALLQDASSGILVVLGNESVDDVLLQTGEYLDVLLSLLVADVEPELVELVGAGALAVEPYVAALSLSELLAVRLGNQRTGQGESLASSRRMQYASSGCQTHRA